MANTENLTPFTKDDNRASEAGKKSKPGKHLSTHIQDLLNDDEFTLDNFLGNGKQFKGAPIKAIITVGIMNALQGDQKWAEWLAKHGYGEKLNIEVADTRKEILSRYGLTSKGENAKTPDKPG